MLSNKMIYLSCRRRSSLLIIVATLSLILELATSSVNSKFVLKESSLSRDPQSSEADYDLQLQDDSPDPYTRSGLSSLMGLAHHGLSGAKLLSGVARRGGLLGMFGKFANGGGGGFTQPGGSMAEGMAGGMGGGMDGQGGGNPLGKILQDPQIKDLILSISNSITTGATNTGNDVSSKIAETIKTQIQRAIEKAIDAIGKGSSGGGGGDGGGGGGGGPGSFGGGIGDGIGGLVNNIIGGIGGRGKGGRGNNGRDGDGGGGGGGGGYPPPSISDGSLPPAPSPDGGIGGGHFGGGGGGYPPPSISDGSLPPAPSPDGGIGGGGSFGQDFPPNKAYPDPVAPIDPLGNSRPERPSRPPRRPRPMDPSDISDPLPPPPPTPQLPSLPPLIPSISPPASPTPSNEPPSPTHSPQPSGEGAGSKIPSEATLLGDSLPPEPAPMDLRTKTYRTHRNHDLDPRIPPQFKKLIEKFRKPKESEARLPSSKTEDKKRANHDEDDEEEIDIRNDGLGPSDGDDGDNLSDYDYQDRRWRRHVPRKTLVGSPYDYKKQESFPTEGSLKGDRMRSLTARM